MLLLVSITDEHARVVYIYSPRPNITANDAMDSNSRRMVAIRQPAFFPEILAIVEVLIAQHAVGELDTVSRCRNYSMSLERRRNAAEVQVTR